MGNQGNIAISAAHVETITKILKKTHTNINIMVENVEPGSKDGQDPGTDVELRVIFLSKSASAFLIGGRGGPRKRG